jgi:hypothetical protein
VHEETDVPPVLGKAKEGIWAYLRGLYVRALITLSANLAWKPAANAW